MQINLSSGNYSIVASGQAFLFRETGDLKIHIANDEGFDVSVVLNFLYNDLGKRVIEPRIVGNDLILDCFNFIETASGLAKPLRIADVGGKNVYMMFWSYLEGAKETKVRRIDYTFYQEI